ncbi:MAG: hypothetical protein MJ250_08945 [Alphaproteobacteria bacterium]|nr:hypothetical protein [Alphaproteobacteria bacterium]
MSCSFEVKDGKITNLEYEEGDFNCSHNQLTSLKGCPEKIGGEFDCSQNQLTSLEGCPKKVEGKFSCSGNFFLVDISDLPSKCESIYIRNCPRIAKFPNQIKNILKFWYPTGWVRRRIKKQPFYEVIEEDDDSITVRQKTIGKQLLDDL